LYIENDFTTSVVSKIQRRRLEISSPENPRSTSSCPNTNGSHSSKFFLCGSIIQTRLCPREIDKRDKNKKNQIGDSFGELEV
jgi:hypothetical protein